MKAVFLPTKGFSGTTNYKGHMDKTKWEWNQGRQVGMAGVGAERLGKGRKLHLNNKV